MTSEITIALVDTDAAGWPAELDRLRLLLGAPHNPTLFPAHFLKATLPKIGGGVVTAGRYFLDPMHEAIEEHLIPQYRHNLRVVRSELGQDAGLYGAAVMAREAVGL